MRIANIVRDEKFIDGVISLQDMFNGGFEHDYIIIQEGNSNAKKFKYIKDSSRIEIVRPLDFLEVLSGGKYAAVFLHSLLSAPLWIIARIPKRVRVFWFSWGYDIYYPVRGLDKAFVPIARFKERTREILNALETSQREKAFSLRRLARGVKRRLVHFSNGITAKRAVSRVDFYSGVLPYEYDLMRNVRFFHARKVEYHYSSIRPPVPFSFNDSNNIILGNSADPSNNHMDALEILMKLDLQGRKIVIPLSYGNMQYADFLCDAVSEKGWHDIVAVRDFIPFEDYASLIGSCGFSIYFHERQQAMGNIFLSLRNGNKVFMSETNLAYEYLKSFGFIVFSVQRDLNQKNLDAHLTESEQRHNYDLFYQWHSDKILQRCMTDIYSRI